MQPVYRAAAAFDLTIVATRKGDGGAVQLILDARGDDTDHALMPIGIEQAHRVAVSG